MTSLDPLAITDDLSAVTSSPSTEALRQWRFRPPAGACDLLLVRHGESEAVIAGREFPRLDGHADPPLADEGHREARAVAERLVGSGINAVWTTTLQRTKQTAAPLVGLLGIEPKVEPDLREVFLGDWDGGEYRRRAATGDPLVKRAMAEQDWGVIPNAESLEAFSGRVRRGINRIAAAHPDQRLAVFVHGGVIGAALAMATGSEAFAFVGAANGSINHLVVTDERWILRRFNDTAHLPTDLDGRA